jgi:hypothetical protein
MRSDFGEWLFVRVVWVFWILAAWLAVGFWARFIFELTHLGWRGGGIFFN